MNAQPTALTALAHYQVRTHNASEQSENRMHSDEVARQFGFKAALVPGVTVFAHMTRPLVERFGERWLASASNEISFAKPAYEGELLSVLARTDATGTGYALTCKNEQGIELARMSSCIPTSRTSVDPRSAIAPAPPTRERPLVTWELMEVGKPFPALAWAPTAADNHQWCEDVRDDLPIYRAGSTPYLHPGLVLRQANFVLRNRFTLPAWIHTGSRIVFHRALRAGSEYEVRAIPEDKWERNGHQFVRLYVAIRCAEATLAEIVHTAIFSPRRSA